MVVVDASERMIDETNDVDCDVGWRLMLIHHNRAEWPSGRLIGTINPGKEG